MKKLCFPLFYSLSTNQQEESIQQHIHFLNQEISPHVSRYGSYAVVLGGKSPLSMVGGYRLNVSKRENLVEKYQYTIPFPRRHTIAYAWGTGKNLQQLTDQYQMERYKFYLSFDLSNKKKLGSAYIFIDKLLSYCSRNKISLMTKTFKHTYDSINLYTWQPLELEKVLQILYPEYVDIFLDTYHFFQKPIASISPYHVGMVQEPISEFKQSSHSGRMEILGRSLDYTINNGQEINSFTFKNACNAAGVLPFQPWFLDRKKR